jgi:hypothetical protein
MNYIYNILIQLIFFLFFSFSILGYGFLLKDKILKIDFNFGEIGILGFFVLYVLSVLINLFLPINIYLSLIILFFGSILFFNNTKNIFISNKLFFCLIFLLLFISSLTINLHDDHLLYQLPYIQYKQEFKIIFGFVFLNDFLAYSHGFYDVMALFQVPFYENRLVFIIPVIFFMFFFFSIIDYYNKKENILSNLIIFIIFLTLFKFTRSKEFGTDIPVIGLLFLIQIYSLKFFLGKEKKYFYKMLVMFSLATIYKVYAVLAIFYFLIFGKKIKDYVYELITKKKIIFVLLIFVSLITFSKNIIHSGCLSYPVVITCFEQETLPWSAGKKLSDWRHEFLKAGVKGWMPHVRESQYKKKIFPAEYNKEFKYNFHKNVFKDPDTERILIVLSILLVTFFLNFSYKEKNLQIKKPPNFKLLMLCSLIPLILWFLITPYIRYGGYAYLPFGLLILYYSIFFKSFNVSKIIKLFLIFGIIYFSSKNFIRINNELSTINIFTLNSLKTKHSFPIPYFRDFEVEEKQLDSKKKIYISKHNWLCSFSQLPCVPGFWENMEINIKEKNGYNFIFVNEKDYIDILNHKLKVFNLSEDRYGNDFNRKIRGK